MKKVWSFLAVFLMLASSVWAGEISTYGSLYGSYVNFGGSDVKDDGWAATAYLNLSDRQVHALELGLTQTRINYDTLPDLDQTDFTLAYTNTGQILKNHAIRLGFHYISSDDDLTDQGKIYFAKVTYFRPAEWNAGLEIDYSDYSDSNVDLDVFQIRPHYGFFFSAFGRRLYSETRFYYIHKDKDVGVSMDNYYSLEQVFTYTVGNMDYKLAGWVGQQIFAVKNEGFVVYNLADRYLGGLEAEVGYRLENNLRLALNLNQQWLEHVGYGDKASQTIVTVSLGGSF